LEACGIKGGLGDGRAGVVGLVGLEWTSESMVIVELIGVVVLC
jgi:hypothetical protein